MAEINTERKTKSQKAKMKSSEERKQLGSVRVIQRNLVYIVGLPLNLADEDVCISLFSFALLCNMETISHSCLPPKYNQAFVHLHILTYQSSH